MNRSYKADNSDFQFSAYNGDVLMYTDEIGSARLPCGNLVIKQHLALLPLPLMMLIKHVPAMVQLIIQLMTWGAVLCLEISLLLKKVASPCISAAENRCTVSFSSENFSVSCISGSNILFMAITCVKCHYKQKRI